MAKRFAVTGEYTLPTPRFQTYNERQADAFFDYWLSLSSKLPGFGRPISESALENVTVRVYRQWPRRKVIIPVVKDGEQPKEKPTNEIGKFNGACPFPVNSEYQSNPRAKPRPAVLWRDALLDRFGTGTYGIYLGEEGVSGAVCYACVKVHDDDRPPKLAIDEVDVSHPDNRGYVQQLKAAGIKIPGDEGYMSEQDLREKQEMEQAHEKLVDRALDNASALGELRGKVEALASSPAVASTPLNDHAAEKAIDMMAKAAESAVDAANKRADAATASTSMPAMVEMVGTLIDKMKPDTTVIVQLEQRLVDLQQAALQRSEKDAQFYRDQLSQVQTVLMTARQTAAETQEKPETDLLEEIRKAKELAGLFSPGAAARDSSSFWEKNLPVILGVVQAGIATIANIAHNAAVARTGQGAVENPPVPAGVPQQVMQSQQQQPQTQQPQNTDEQAALAAGVPPPAIPMLQKVTDAFVAHFIGAQGNNPQSDGHTFAAWVATGGIGADETQEGRTQYQLMVQAERDNPGALIWLVRRWPPINSRIGGFPQPAFEKFVQEFMEYDAWMQQQAA